MNDKDETTLDFSRPTWGHAVYISRIIDGGHKITGTLHSTPGPKEGDYFLLPTKGPKKPTTRYKFTKVKWLFNVDDMYSFKADFAPRSEVLS